MKSKYLLFIFTLLIGQMGCIKENPSPQPTANVIFRDDFKDNFKVWFLQTTPPKSDTVFVNIANDKLTIYNKGFYPAMNVWQKIQIDTNKNWSIKSSMIWKQGATNYGFGLLWGGNDQFDQNLYGISPAGAYIIGIYKNKIYNEIKPWTYVGLVNYGENVLEIKKEGTLVSFLINNKTAISIKNLKFYGENIGLFVTNKMEVDFDYLEVKEW